MWRWRQMKIQRQVGDRWWPALQAVNHWRVSHMLISFAFGNYLTDNSMEDVSEETATGQENHLKGYCNNPGQKWRGTKPKQWQWEWKWGARVKRKREQKGKGLFRNSKACVQMSAHYRWGPSGYRVQSPSGGRIYASRDQDGNDWARDPDCSRCFSSLCARELLAQRTPWQCHLMILNNHSPNKDSLKPPFFPRENVEIPKRLIFWGDIWSTWTTPGLGPLQDHPR